MFSDCETACCLPPPSQSEPGRVTQSCTAQLVPARQPGSCHSTPLQLYSTYYLHFLPPQSQSQPQPQSHITQVWHQVREEPEKYFPNLKNSSSQLGWQKVKGVCNEEPDLSFPASSHGASEEPGLVMMGINQLGGMIVQIGKFYLCSADLSSNPFMDLRVIIE